MTTMKKILLSAALLAVSVCGFSQTFDNIPTGEGFYINKLIPSPSGSDLTKEYIEIRGTADAVIPADLYLAVIEGDGNSGSRGKVTEAIQLGDGTRTFGSNGIFVIVCNHTDDNTAVVTTNAFDGLINPNANVLEIELTGTDVTSSSSSAITGFTPDIGYDGNLSDQTATYMLVSAPANPDDVRIDGSSADDVDGIIDAEGDHTSWVLYDSITYMDDNDEGEGEFGYGQIVIAQNQTVAGANQFTTTSATLFNFSDPLPDGESDSDVNIMIRQGERTGFTTDDWAVAASSNNDDAPNWSFSTTENKTLPMEALGYADLNTVYGGLNPTFTTLATEEFAIADIAVYPNPANDNIFYEVRNGEQINVIIFDVTGKRVLAETVSNNTTNISTLSKGVYFVTMQTNNTSITKKIFKN